MSFSVYWDYAMTIPLEEIVYLHCHQQGGSTPTCSVITTIICTTLIIGCVLFLSFLAFVTPQLNTDVHQNIIVNNLIRKIIFCSRQRGDGGAGQSGWDPKTSTSLPQRRPLAPVPLLPGERPSSTRPAGPSALVSEGKGQDRRSFLRLALWLQIQNTNCTYGTFFQKTAWKC